MVIGNAYLLELKNERINGKGKICMQSQVMMMIGAEIRSLREQCTFSCLPE